MRVTGSAPRAYKEKDVTRFDRHVLWLQPDTYLIADNLETPEPQHLKSGDAAGRLEFFDTPGLRFEQTDEFTVPPTGFARDGRKGGQSAPQWHLKASTATPATKQRFVSVLQVYRAGEERALPKVSVENKHDGVGVSLSDGRQGSIRWR